ncbi:DsrE family protein [Halothiobacillus sp. DCM-1]|uniref:DsrE family protein n=1 Tax=Halothiobacillus sp. DCM-1 TaxID=3112558 RepID=UPI00324621E5
MKTNHSLRSSVLVGLLLASHAVFATDATPSNPPAQPIAQVMQEKPFAKQHIALQITDADAGKQQLLLNVARNLIKYYGADNVDLEVVALGPGLRLLLKDNALAPQIDALASDGVRFSACQNSMQAMEKTLGHPLELIAVARTTPAGIVRLYELSKAGYFIDRP